MLSGFSHNNMNNKRPFPKMKIYHAVVVNLNKKGILPFAAREWNVALIQAVIGGRRIYTEVFEELRIVMTGMELQNEYELWIKEIKDRIRSKMLNF